jgi:recombination protein RecA
MAKAKAKAGKLSLADIQKNINKKAGMNVAHNLNEANPTEVKQWIPTGSRWLDSIICKGQYAGVPVGKIVEIAGLEATGKSYMAAQIAANAQKQGIDVVYFDSESAIDPSFLERAGCNLDNLLYIQAKSVEFVLETIDDLLKVDNQFLFVWDSLALTPVEQEVQGDFDPMSQMAMKARVLARAMSKLTINIANKQATLLVLNQLKTNITRVAAEAMTTPYVTPGGKAMAYAYSLRIWLTGRKAKASYVLDDNGFRIGSEVKVKLEKSRFGTAGRQCNFRILWGTDDAAIQDDESLFDAVKGSSNILQSGAWYTLVHDDGQEEKFQAAKWVEKMQDDKFRQRVYQIMDEEVIMKFHTREGNAEDFYDNDDDVQVEEDTFSFE